MANTKHYRYWACIVQRCTNPRHKYWTDYGGRGITICDRWRKFENFFSDMGSKPPGKSLDRIDNNGPYSPENCRWATQKEQLRNTRRTVYLTHNGITKSVNDWGDEVGIDPNIIKSRLAKNWPPEKALTLPRYARLKKL